MIDREDQVVNKQRLSPIINNIIGGSEHEDMANLQVKNFYDCLTTCAPYLVRLLCKQSCYQ